MMRRLLYLITGVLTAIPVYWALAWAVWGAPVSATEHISLLGSLCLVVAARIGKPNRRFAARLALVGTVGIWSFYMPGIVGLVTEKLNDQELTLTVFRWSPSPSPLQIEQWASDARYPERNISPAEIQRIKDTGITGTLSLYAPHGIYGSGKKSGVILIMREPVREAIDLKEPDASNIVYVQDRQRWKKFPPDAPTLRRTIRIQPLWDDPNQSSLLVELSSGMQQGFGVWWPKTAPEVPVP